MAPNDVYRLLIQSVIPRPIAFVSTLSRDGIANLAPFSFFNAVSSNPATVILGIGFRPDGSKKDTLKNIEETGEFVVNSAHRWLVDPLVYSAGGFAPEVDEISLVGLTSISSHLVKPSRIKESGVHFECTLQQLVPIGNGATGSTVVVFGEIRRIHIADGLITDGRIDPKKFEAIGRLGGISYAELGDIFQREVPKV